MGPSVAGDILIERSQDCTVCREMLYPHRSRKAFPKTGGGSEMGRSKAKGYADSIPLQASNCNDCRCRRHWRHFDMAEAIRARPLCTFNNFFIARRRSAGARMRIETMKAGAMMQHID